VTRGDVANVVPEIEIDLRSKFLLNGISGKAFVSFGFGPDRFSPNVDVEFASLKCFRTFSELSNVTFVTGVVTTSTESSALQ
jgi:hypothetical protein